MTANVDKYFFYIFSSAIVPMTVFLHFRPITLQILYFPLQINSFRISAYLLIHVCLRVAKQRFVSVRRLATFLALTRQ